MDGTLDGTAARSTDAGTVPTASVAQIRRPLPA
jgi:hypothetical protein